MSRHSRNYVMSPRNPFIRGSIASNDQFCGSNGQCTEYACQEWIDGNPYYPELVRDDRYGFALCPRCGVSYGKDALTGDQYTAAKQEGSDT
jgi:hypothetical protein